MADDEANLLLEAKKLPFEERLAHKNWKVRNAAYIDIASICDGVSDPKDPRLKEFGPLFKKAVSDSNAPAQEKALDALIAYQKAADSDAGKFAKEVCDAIAAKCLTGRTKTLEKANTAFLLWVELEAAEALMDAMDKAVKSKVAKAVVPAVEAVYDALRGFGIKVVPPKRVLKLLPELFNHADEKVRAMAKALAVELTKWIGKDAVKRLLFDGLREATQKEMEAELEKVEGQAVPTRRIRSEMEMAPVEVEELDEEQASSSEVNGDAQPGAVVVDEYELCDPVDILTPLNKTSFWAGIVSTKWSERKEAVAELTRLASARRIASADFTPVNRTLKKLITDVNMAVSLEAIQAVGLLAAGLRSDYAGGSQMLLPILLDKFKEKKPTIVAALRETLRSMFRGACIGFNEITEDFKVAVKNKVPSARAEALLWVAECIEYSKAPELLKIHKEYVPILMESLQDATPEIRDAAFLGLANMAKVVGMKPLERSLEKLDDVRKKKLNELITATASAVPQAVQTGQGALPGASVTAISRSDNAGPTQGASAKTAAASFLNKRPVVRPTASGPKASSPGDKTSAGKIAAKITIAASHLGESLELNLDPQEVEELAEARLNPDIVRNLKSANWKERLEGMTALKDVLEPWNDEHDSGVQVLISLLLVFPGWGDKNVQVLQKMLELLTFIAQKVSTFPKNCAVHCISGAVEKIGDIKTRMQAHACLLALAEAVGPQFVFGKAYTVVSNNKNPKVLAEALLWFAQAVSDFGTNSIDVKELIGFCKDPGLVSSTAPCRAAANKVLGALHVYLGPELKSYLSDLKPAQMAPIEAEFEKNPFQGAASEPTRSAKSTSAVVKVENGIGADVTPREDISGKLTGTLIENLGSSDWKVRQESLDAVDRILEDAHKRIQPTGTGDLFGALRGRLFDTNKNLIVMTLATLGNLAAAMGPPVDKASKGIVTDMLKCMSDPKKQMREAVIRSLDAWVTAVLLDKLLPYLAVAVVDPKVSADGRKELLEWLSKQVPKASEQPDISLLLKPCATGLQDKSSEVRKATESLLVELMRATSPEAIIKAARAELSSSTLPVVVTAVDKYRSMFAAGPESTDDGPPQKHSGVRLASGNSAVNRSIHVASTSGGMRSSVSRSRTTGGGGVMNGPGRVLKQSTVELLQDAAAQGLPLFNLRESIKEEREKIIPRGVKMKFEVPGPEQAQDLEEDIRKFFREDLARRLCSKDFKLHGEGLEILRKAIPEHIRDMEEVLDLILRWSVFRLCESNTTALLKVLDFLHELFEALKGDGFMLTECEANIFVPCLIEKSGHNIANVREKMREMTRLLCNVYAASKILTYVVDGLRSKNNRTRILCVEYIESMIERYGIGVMGGSKVPLVVVASLTTERDTEIRKSALNTLSTAYKLLGDDIWKQVGKLSDAQKGLLEDKFRWKAREMEKRREGYPGGRTASQRSKEDGFSNGNIGPTGYASGMTEAVVVSSRDAEQEAGQPENWKEAMDCVSSTDNMELMVTGLRVMSTELSRVTDEQDTKAMEEYAQDADRLIALLTAQVTRTFNLSMVQGQSSRPCKYVLNTLVQVFQVTAMGHAVSAPHLQSLIAELLLWLLDGRVQSVTEDGPNLLKALNVLMLKILDNAKPTSALVALLGLLQSMHPGDGPRPGSAMSPEDFLDQRETRFSDLVVRCLIKLTKGLAQNINEIDLDRLLLSIHEYLQDLGLDEIRRRAGADDKPLRMVKTVLHEVCKVVGPAIKGHLSLLPIDMDPAPIVLAYIDLNLQTLAAKRVLTPVKPDSVLWRDQSAGESAAQSSDGVDNDALRYRFLSVFKTIGDKRTSKDGLYELWSITQEYPQVDIGQLLHSTSDEMKRFIKDGLAEVDREIREREQGAQSEGEVSSASYPEQPSPAMQSTPQSSVSSNAYALEVMAQNGVERSEANDERLTKGSLNLGASHGLRPTPPGEPLNGGGNTPSLDGAWNVEEYRERMRLIHATTEGSPVRLTPIGRSASASVSKPMSSHEGVNGSGLKARLGQLKSRGVEPYMY